MVTVKMSKKPNFLIIMSDQHSPDTIAGKGHPVVKTPSLDRLMASGISFSNAYCSYPMCTPSRASFMTGMLTPEHGVWELGSPLGSDIPTWAHIFRSAGYTTSISGRMHFIGYDKNHGFERVVHPDVTDMLIPFTYGDWDKPQNDEHVMLGVVKSAGPLDKPSDTEGFDQAVVDAALKEISYLTSDQESRPWALMVGLMHPHFPYNISRKYYDMYDEDEIPMPRIPPEDQLYEEFVPEQLNDNRKWLGLTADGVSEEEVRAARQSYYGMITCMDEQIGRLMDHLHKLGVDDNTWVIYLSDHGDNMGEHGFWSKMNFYEESVRIPLIVAPPGYNNPGVKCDALVSIVDWMTTVLELTEQESYFENLPGRSLLPLIENPAQELTDRAVVSDYACDGTRVPMRMVRYKEWKACFATGFNPLLFDLEKDPGEWNDLGEQASSQQIIEELHEIACSDGWHAESLEKSLLVHKRRLKYINNAEED